MKKERLHEAVFKNICMHIETLDSTFAKPYVALWLTGGGRRKRPVYLQK